MVVKKISTRRNSISSFTWPHVLYTKYLNLRNEARLHDNNKHIDYEITNCKANIEFYKNEIENMQAKIERLKKEKNK